MIMIDIQIKTEYIKLQDLLKYAAVASTGGEAKMMVQDGRIAVNGEICTMRGRKIRPGDIVSAEGREYTVSYADR
jgi:ribosome-associated protein